jgi:hypothetical protein
MPQKKLDLFKLTAGIMAKSPAGSSKIVRREPRHVHVRGCLLDDMPDRLFRDTVSPEFSRPTDTSE